MIRYIGFFKAVFLLIIATIFSCGIVEEQAGSGSEAGNSSRIAYLSDSLFINVPSSATGDAAVLSKSVQKSTEGQILEHYAAVRGFIGFANILVQNEEFGVKKLISTYRDSLPWNVIEKQTAMSGKLNNVTWVASYNDKSEYPYDLKIYTGSVASTNLAFSLAFNGSEQNPKGKAYYRFDLLEPQKTKSELAIMVDFSASSGMRSLNLSLTSKTLLTDSIEGFKNLTVQLRDSSGVLHLSGASYHPNVANLLPDTNEYCYEFYGFSDTLNNLSILYVGIPPADINSNDMSIFREYDLSSILIKRFIRSDIRTLNDTIQRFIVTSYKDSLTLRQIYDSAIVAGVSWLRPSSDILTINRENFEYFIDLNKSNNSDWFQSFLLLRYLKQPVYFDKNGYAGNGTIVPERFQQLTTIKRILPLQNPRQIKFLTITPW